MDVETLKYERNVLMVHLKQWDDLLPKAEREKHPARARLAEEIKRYQEMIDSLEHRVQPPRAA
jgi:hypothetical protein